VAFVPPSLQLPRVLLTFERPLLCAVLNLTPDSFSDGGRLSGVESAVEFALRCLDAGANLLDVGGESTRPQGATPVSAEDEIRRVEPVIAALARRVDVPISVDTTKARVAEAAVAAGAQLVNDVSGGGFEPAIVEVAARTGAGFVLGHLRGASMAEVHTREATPPTADEVEAELVAAVAALPAALRARTIVDPGLGFGKRAPQNLELIARAGRLAAATGRPVMLGPSRKRFLGELTGRPIDDRDDATVGACLAGVAAGAHILRVHDVKKVRDALVVFEAVRAAGAGASSRDGAGGTR
jgi:dihydropteroate synthase